MNKRAIVQTVKHRYLDLGYLQSYLEAFTNILSEKGYNALTIEGYYNSVSHFSAWLQNAHIPLNDINYNVVCNFAKHRCHCSGNRAHNKVSRRYSSRVRCFVNYLYEQEIITSEFNSKPPVVACSAYLVKFKGSLQLRGLASITISKYVYYVSKLLAQLGGDPKNYTSCKVRQIICDAVNQKSRAEAKKYSTALRAYLRFLTVEGVCCPDLDKAIPTVAEWKLSALPKYITSEEMELVIEACNISLLQGIRDRAIILLLCRLALRASDISNMRIDDINWAEGSLRVCGKGRREVVLPLPQDVGDALLDYLNKVRPSVAIDTLFLCLNAPYRPFPNSSGISNVVRAALARASITDPPTRGAHLLRHSAATHMVRQGATLETVSTVLRHRSLDMTGHYAKVDIPRLRQIAQPWPEGAPC